jgi:hypothetical protein
MTTKSPGPITRWSRGSSSLEWIPSWFDSASLHGGKRRSALVHRGGRRRSAPARRGAWCIGVGIGGQRTCIGVGIDASRRRAQSGVSGRWWAGRPASPQTVETTRWSWRRFWTAPTPIRAVKGMRGATTARAMAHRAATNARDGSSGDHQRPRWLIVRPPRIVSG